MYNLKYLYLSNKDLLIVTLKENNDIVAYYENGKWSFFNETLHELSLNNTITEISDMDVAVITFGVFPNRLFKENGYPIYEEEINDNIDTLENFLLRFKDYAIDDYHRLLHNKEKSLKYLATELDIHYENAGYVSFLDDYYDEYLLRKNEFEFVKIEKIYNDYLIEFNYNIIQ